MLSNGKMYDFPIMRVKIADRPNPSIRAKIFDVPKRISANLGGAEIIIESIQGKPYEGSYSVIPDVTSQTMETKNKVMKENVIIESIPYAEVSNNSGGTTVTIGREV